MSKHYILDGHEPLAVDLMTWARWFDSDDQRRVGSTVLDGEAHVSTVFLGLDHAFGVGGPPILFETMIFGGPHGGYCERYATWAEAEAGHQIAVALASSPTTVQS
jgi:hypothetical protein